MLVDGKCPRDSSPAEASKLPSAPLLPVAVAFPLERLSALNYGDARSLAECFGRRGFGTHTVSADFG